MLKNKRIGQIMIVAVFVAAICMQMFWWFMFGIYVDLQNSDNIEELQNIENRKMASKPNFSVYTYPQYFSDYEKYFNDNYTFRGPLISINSKIDYFLFQKSTNENVILGESDWLFYTPTLADYEKNNLYTEDELNKIRMDLMETKQYFEKMGTEFFLFIAPNKNTIYGEYMPQGVEVKEGISRTEQMVQYLRENTDIKIIYPKEEMQQTKEKYPDFPMYFKLDTHWNYMGGYVGAKALLEELGITATSFGEMSVEQINEPLYHWNGYDLVNMLGLTGNVSEDTNYRFIGYSNNEVIYEGNLVTDKDAFWGESRTYSDAEDKRKVYFARDSFGEGMVPFLAAEFGEMYTMHIDFMTKSTIEAEQPDIFIYEIVERNGLAGINVHNWAE